MKRKIFTIFMMLALVIVAGKAFAQNARYTPVTGSTWTYTVSGLTTATDADLTINYSTTSPTADAGLTGPPDRTAGNGYTIETASSFDDGNDEVTIEINWLLTGTYHLWVVVDNGTCTSMAYQNIEVSANNFDATIVIAGIDDSATDWAGTAWDDDDEAGPVCPMYGDGTGVNFEIDGPYSDGSSYLFARVSKVNDNDGTWNLSITAGDASSIAYYNASTTSWVVGSSYSDIPDATTDVLIRFTVENIPAGYNTFDCSVTATENSGSIDLPDTNGGNDDDSIVISTTPDMSGATFE